MDMKKKKISVFRIRLRLWWIYYIQTPFIQREAAIKANMMEPEEIDKGIRDLYRTTEKDGVFCYTFFKAVAEKR